MTALPRSIEQAFGIAVSELGFCSASWLFLREIAAVGGEPLVHELKERLGQSFPVLDAVAQTWLDGQRAPVIELSGLLPVLSNVRRLLVVGLETDFLDKLVESLPGVRMGLVRPSLLDPDCERICANYGNRIELTDLNSFQRWAGAGSVVITFLYGSHGTRGYVRSSWLRVFGPDVHTQFRDFVAWDVLRRTMTLYPRWLSEVPLAEFTKVF